MINPGGSYLTRQQAQGNHITQKCVIEVGNLALPSRGASASASSAFSADWPAAAAINGDQTHINAGAASVADNAIGGGVWQGSSIADAGGNVSEWLNIDLGQARRVNRVKIIFWPDATLSGNLGKIGADTFTIYRGDGGAWSGGFGGGGFGGGGFGGLVFTPAGSGIAGLGAWDTLVDKSAEIGKAATSISGGIVSGNINDMVVFEDPAHQSVRYLEIDISKLQSGSIRSRIVAVEITLSVDVSSFVKSARRTRAKDYHLQRRNAAQLEISLRNHDKRFNDKHVPTASEIADGVFSDFIRPHLPIRYYAGFSGQNVQMFTGTIETWNPDSSRRNVDTVALDFLKSLLTPKISSNLKTGQLIEALIEYIANRQGFPSNMIILDSTTLTVGYFYPQGQSIQSVLNALQDATGDAEIFVDEYGRLLYRNYLTTVSHQYQAQTKDAWLAGTLVNIDTDSQPGSILRAWWQLDDLTSNNFTTTTTTASSWIFSVGSGKLTVETTGAVHWIAAEKALEMSVGLFHQKISATGVSAAGNSNTRDGAVVMFYSAAASYSAGSGPLLKGYGLRFNLNNSAGSHNQVELVRFDSQLLVNSTNVLANLGTFTTDGYHAWDITMSAAGLITVYKDGVSAGSATDTTYTGTNGNPNLFWGVAAQTTNSSSEISLDIADIYYSTSTNYLTAALSNSQAVWVSPVFGFGATATLLGNLASLYSTPGATSVLIETRSGPVISPDGSWTAYATATPGSPFPSPLNLYGQVRITMADAGTLAAGTILTPMVSQLSVTYQDQAGSARTAVSADWSAADYGLLLGNNRILSSIVGGNNFIYTQAIIKANPLAPSLVSQTAWQGTNGDAAIGAGNPLYLPVGDTILNVSFGSTSYNVPQTVNLTLGTATATATLSSHPTSPILTITVTVAGSIAGLTISGYPFLTNTTVQATAYASNFVRQNYDENIDELDNDYIDNVALAQDVANSRMARFGQGPLDWIKEGRIRFFPGAQLNDRVHVVDSFSEIDADYYLLSTTDEISQSNSKSFTARTTGEFIKIA